MSYMLIVQINREIQVLLAVHHGTAGSHPNSVDLRQLPNFGTDSLLLDLTIARHNLKEAILLLLATVDDNFGKVGQFLMEHCNDLKSLAATTCPRPK